MTSKTVKISLMASISCILFSACGVDNKEKPIINSVSYSIGDVNTQNNTAYVSVISDIEKEDSTKIYDNGISLDFESGNAINGSIILSSGKHKLKVCAENKDGTVCSDEKTYFISENLSLNLYKKYPLVNKSTALTNDGKDLVYGTKKGELYKLNLNTKKSSKILNINEQASGLAYISSNSYFYSNTNLDRIYKLTISSNTKENISSTSFPDGLAYYNNRIYSVTNDRSGILTIFNTNGDIYDTLDTGIDDICGLAHSKKYLYILGEDGSIYQTNPKTGTSNKIFTNSNLFDKDSGYNGLEAITVLNNYIYVSYINDSSIYKINLDLSKYE